MHFSSKICISFVLSLLHLSVLSGCGSEDAHTDIVSHILTLSWDAPTVDVDGTQTIYGDIRGYRIYCSTSSGSHTKGVNYNFVPAPSTSVSANLNLAPGSYYCVVTTLGSWDEESDFSAEVVKIIK